MKSKLLIFGGNGQVGRALNQLAEGNVVVLGRDEADLSKPESLRKIIADLAPTKIINAAAYTAVDKAEEEEALATIINAEAPGVMAEEAAKRGIPFVHYSTDYVFNGSGERPWKEDDATAPLNAYGRSKLAGEKAVLAAGGQALIFRISWVYDAYGKNFLNTMLRLGKDRETLKVVADQYGAPCYAPHVAQATLAILQFYSPLEGESKPSSVSVGGVLEQERLPPTGSLRSPTPPQGGSKSESGIYHMANSGVTTWHEFATTIFDEAKKRGMKLAVKEVLPIPASEYPTPATRPQNSRLDCSKLQATFGVTLPAWEDGVREALETI